MKKKNFLYAAVVHLTILDYAHKKLAVYKFLVVVKVTILK